MKRIFGILSAAGIVAGIAWLLYWAVFNCHDVVYIIVGIIMLCLIHIYSNLD